MNYRLREMQTGWIEAWKPADDFDPIFYTPPDGYFLEVEVGVGEWDIYTKPTISEMIANIHAAADKARNCLDDVEELTAILEKML